MPNASLFPRRQKTPTAPLHITIKPAAGPFMVKREPAKKLTTTPPIMALTKPKMAGKSEAFAMPKLSGKANKDTKKPDKASEEIFCLNPAKPSAGMFNLLFILIEKLMACFLSRR